MLDKFPEEILFQIIEKVNANDIVEVALSCKTLYNIINCRDNDLHVWSNVCARDGIVVKRGDPMYEKIGTSYSWRQYYIDMIRISSSNLQSCEKHSRLGHGMKRKSSDTNSGRRNLWSISLEQWGRVLCQA
eukprot:CFRG2102T1